ncbi:bifunctional class I SAM-dependent methyltransferase/N-acetyltransferase [Streptomyces sp. NPDC097619]|uniref:bifunctional class I SAM-dependent methyltransferase/N-acetyltransferase n=1 Tax=Streptomyces sp. NPDC097619 TaxID=3157228 RepID=UPI003316D04B
MTDDTFFEAFLTLHRGLPRQGPGSDATTRHLLSLAGPLPERPRVLDLGCGPGRSALLLAAEAGAEVTAVDLHQGFLDELAGAARARGLDDRVHPVRADMGDLPFPDGSFDLIWAESSVYSIGFDTALRAWRRLLAPGGTLVLTECVWTDREPSEQARAFWAEHYPLRTDAANLGAAAAAGYGVLGAYAQPESDWDAYYGPLGERAERADTSLPGMTEAVAGARREIALRRDHGGAYGYSGYVLRPVAEDGRWSVRRERAGEAEAVFAVHAAAFETPAEAELVDRLRADDAWLPELSWVAEAPDGRIAAHCLITRCRIGGAPALVLAPVGTLPEFQGTGAGAAVIRAALDAARALGEPQVLVLGHPGYYPRFGFVPAGPFGIDLPFEVPAEAHMVSLLDPAAPVPSGAVAYAPPFGV